MKRETLLTLVKEIIPYDQREISDQKDVVAWIESTAPLYRIQKPDIPPKHLVSYFVIVDPKTHKMLLQDHLLAKLWVPAGGHVDPGEDPAETVRRECIEELGVEARFLGSPSPHFVTVTTTNGAGRHIDVSLWYILKADETTQFEIEPGKFAAIKWWNINTILETPIDEFDPELHRFINKTEKKLGY